MKKNLKAIIFTIFCVLLALSITACPINDDESGGFTVVNDDSSIVYLSQNWNKNENSIPYQLAYNPSRYDSPDRYEYVEELSWWHINYQPRFIVISSMDELNETLHILNEGVDVYDYGDFGVHYGYNYTRLRGEYNESYFSENILILWTVSEGSGSNGNWVNSLDVSGDTLTINTLRFNHNDSGLMGTADMAYWVFEIHVKKIDITGVTNIEMATKWIRFVPDCVTITIRDAFFSKVVAESFNIEDFEWDNIAEIRYTVLNGINMHWVTLGLKEPGTKNAKALAEHLEYLYFVKDVYGWTFTYLNL